MARREAILPSREDSGEMVVDISGVWKSTEVISVGEKLVKTGVASNIDGDEERPDPGCICQPTSEERYDPREPRVRPVFYNTGFSITLVSDRR